MRFFYISPNNQAVGPVEGDELVDLRRQGAIGDDTRVAPEGDALWRTFADFYKPGSSVPVPPVLPPTPLSIRVFGILNIVFGSLGLLCLPLTAGIMVALLLGKTQEAYGTLHNGWLVFSLVLGAFSAGALLLSGIGLCRLREWGRKLALVCAGVDIAQALVSFAINLMTSPLLLKHHLDCSKYWLSFSLFAVVLVVGLAYPAALLVFLRRPAARAALLARE
jgi:hypothetical protein